MITKLTFRNLQANLGRFAMTTFGVVLAVSFVVSAFVLGDGLRNTFDGLSTEIVSGTDLEVRPTDEFGSVRTFDDEDVSIVLAVDGVDQAVGLVSAPENSVRPITPAGDEIPTAGPPQLAFNWTDAAGFSPLTLVEGTSPGMDEFLIDVGSATTHGFEIGETYTVVSGTGRHDLTLSGVTQFGDDNATLGAVLMSMNTGQTGELFGTGGFDSIAVALTENAKADLASAEAAVAQALPDTDVLNQTSLQEEQAAEFNTQIDIIQSVLLGFAGVSLLVSVFIIGNTFAIVLQQRTREMGLLRLIGADAKQLRRSALGEAGLIGTIASAIGIPGGIGVAAGLTALFSAIGVDLPDYDIIVSPRTIAIALGVGIGVTLIAAWWPTRNAVRVPAMSALRTGASGDGTIRAARVIAGVVTGAVGAVLAIIGVTGASSTTATIVLMSAGSVAVFVGVTLVSPRLVAPVAGAFALFFERLGMPGRLAVRNSNRQATRTATTATALMIGLAVVSMALVVGESVKATLAEDLDTAVQADYLLSDQASEAGFPTTVVDEVAADPTFEAVTGFRLAEMQVGDDIDSVTAVRFADMDELFNLEVTTGGYDTEFGSLVVSSERAELDGLALGDTIDVTMETGVDETLVVSGIFDDDSIVQDDWLVDVSLFDSAAVDAGEVFIAFTIADGVDDATSTAAVDALEQRYPQGELETAEQFRERVEGLIDQILSVLNALVALAVIIALIGIANTLALSVSERTREIGLLRAVGMSQRGVRRMIRYESAVISAFGALLGVLMGIGLGWLMVTALPAAFASTVAVPQSQIIVLVVVAAVAGLVAALLPARRAGRMNVLAAIGN